MPVGDVVSNLVSVAAGGNLNIQPAGTAEWVIHNIYHAYDVDIVFTDGVNTLTFTTEAGAGALSKYAFHVRNGIWIRVVNRDAANPRLIGYDGIITHV